MLKTEDRGWLSNMFSRAVRVTREVSVGDVCDRGLFKATLTAVTPDGHDALEVSFEFLTPLDDPDMLLMCYDGERYAIWKPSREWKLLNATVDEYGF